MSRETGPSEVTAPNQDRSLVSPGLGGKWWSDFGRLGSVGSKCSLDSSGKAFSKSLSRNSQLGVKPQRVKVVTGQNKTQGNSVGH